MPGDQVAARCAGIDAGLLKGDTYSASNFDRLPNDVKSGNAYRPGRRQKQRREYADRGRLAGAVGPQQAVYLSGPNLE